METDKDAPAETPEPAADETSSDERLDIEGPNESAPGHEPNPDEAAAAERPADR